MTRRTSISRPLRFLLPVVLLATISCKSSSSSGAEAGASSGNGKSAAITNDYEAAAQVVAISKEDRRVTFRRGDGNVFELTAGDEVKNFDQLTIGQQLRVRYRESLRATLLPPGEAVKLTQSAFETSGAPVGSKPAGTTSAAIGVRVRVTSIDAENHIVTYQLPSGDFAARKVQTEQGREFVKKLEVGDVVQLDIQQSLALEIH